MWAMPWQPEAVCMLVVVRVYSGAHCYNVLSGAHVHMLRFTGKTLSGALSLGVLDISASFARILRQFTGTGRPSHAITPNAKSHEFLNETGCSSICEISADCNALRLDCFRLIRQAGLMF